MDEHFSCTLWQVVEFLTSDSKCRRLKLLCAQSIHLFKVGMYVPPICPKQISNRFPYSCADVKQGACALDYVIGENLQSEFSMEGCRDRWNGELLM